MYFYSANPCSQKKKEIKIAMKSLTGTSCSLSGEAKFDLVFGPYVLKGADEAERATALSVESTPKWPKGNLNGVAPGNPVTHIQLFIVGVVGGCLEAHTSANSSSAQGCCNCLRIR